MARAEGIYRRPDSSFWWINATLPNGQRIRQSAGTENREDAEALLAKLKLDAYRGHHFGIKPQRAWQEAVVRYLDIKRGLRSYKDLQRICRLLDPYLGPLMLDHINGDVIWRVVQGESKKGNKPATVNRYLATIRSVLRMARDELQLLDTIPKIRLLPGEVERDRWLTRAEADRLIACCAPHFTPWRTEHRPCWHCASFKGLLYGGSAAACSLVNGPRVRSMPDAGCASFQREVGADDEPDQAPAELRTVEPHAGPWRALEGPPAVVVVQWAP